MIVYKTTNLTNGKIYVGKDRYDNPAYLGSGKILKAAIARHGVDAFVKETLEDGFSTEEELDRAEQKWIRDLNAMDRGVGYNIAEGGTGGKTMERPWNYGVKMKPLTEEHKRKVSETLKERYANGEIVNGMTGRPSWNKGLPVSEAERSRMAERARGKKPSAETRRKMSEAKRGRRPYEMTDEIRAKISQSLLGRKLPREMAERMSQSRKGVPQRTTTCPHCGVTGGIPAMKRWHFDNCKGENNGR